MSKPEPNEAFEWFKNRILQDSILLGVDMDKNVSHHVQLLVEAVDRAIFNLKFPVGQPSKEDRNKSIKRFIAIFNDRFFKLVGTVPNQKPKAEHYRQIAYLIDKLTESNSDLDDYLLWLFGDFYSDTKNNNFLPPQVGFAVGNFALDKYLFARKDIFEKKRQTSIKNAELTDILNRYRTVIRKISGDPQRIEDFKKVYESYKTGAIELRDFKEQVIKLEEVVSQTA